MKRIVSFILCFSFIIFSVCYVFFLGKPQEEEAKDTYNGILRLWHIDSFEGGKGSRAAFLNRAAGRYEKRQDGLYIMVNTYTAEGAEQAIKNGEYPDLLSFSCGLDGAAELCRALSFRFGGGEIGQNCYAYPWCGGEYYLFCLEEDFSQLSSDNLLISDGGNNLPWAAAAMYGIVGEVACQDSTSAYVNFLNGKYRYMLGTQRDVCRFQTRGVNVYSQVLTQYNDLYQYIAITSPDEEAVSACEEFVSQLLSDENQAVLSDIGMYSPKDINAENTLSAFISGTGLNEVREQGKTALRTGDIKILKTYLKALN